MTNPSFFGLIIGTEILNRRRQDRHFDFLSNALLQRGHKLSGSFVIEDDPDLIIRTIEFIKNQPDSVLFSFGGIGSTPDDHTRQCAAAALKDGKLYLHKEAEDIIKNRVDTAKYPHSINMAMLPKGANLLENPVNKMPAFSLDDRYFFMPGFPQMSHPMVDNILSTHFNEGKEIYRYTLTALCREGEMISAMEQMPKGVEFSSLPKLMDNGWQTVISVASHDKDLAKQAFGQFASLLDEKNIYYSLNDTC